MGTSKIIDMFRDDTSAKSLQQDLQRDFQLPSIGCIIPKFPKQCTDIHIP